MEPTQKHLQAPATNPTVVPMYIKSVVDGELRQAEIISDLTQHEYDSSSGQVTSTEIPFGILLAQDCDLLRDFEAMSAEKPPVLNGALIYELKIATDAKAQLHGVSWQPLAQNNNERFHFFQMVPADSDLLGLGLPELVLDFRRYFTLPPFEIFRQTTQGAKRRCRLNSPYREQLQNRAGFYIQRVALP